MYHTWFFQKRLAAALHDRLKSLQLVECFSQQKDELILGFANDHSQVYLLADLTSDAGFISVKDDFARARKNSVDLFKDVMGQTIQRVYCFEHERSFAIEMKDGFELIFKMHGSRSNILLSRSNEVISIFRNNLPADREIVPNVLHNPCELDKPNIIRLIGKRNTYLIDNQSFDPIHFIDKINNSSIQIDLIEGIPALKLTEMPNPMLITNDPIEASNKLVELHQRNYQFGKEKQLKINELKREISQSESYISKSEAKLAELKSKRDPQEIGNLLMANLHQIPKGATQVELEDFYTDQSITLKLNPLLSPQINAENYYRRAKNRSIEFEKIADNIELKKKLIERKLNLIHQLETTENSKELRALINANQQAKKASETVLPYSVYEIATYQVLVGKNAKSNDHLTMKVASKNDLWLHAKDVAGSHVIIREKPGSNFPKNVIEQAAQLAAFYSKRKTDSLCPVIYTPRKFVRKVKGAPAGQVMVDKEQVVLVVPTDFK